MAKTVKILERFGHKGQFVKYPNYWDRRIPHTGKRRYDTSCDLLIGICACGDRHCEEDGWIKQLLEDYAARIETHEEWLIRIREVEISA